MKVFLIHKFMIHEEELLIFLKGKLFVKDKLALKKYILKFQIKSVVLSHLNIHKQIQICIFAPTPSFPPNLPLLISM